MNLISQLAIIKLLYISVFCKLYAKRYLLNANSILTTSLTGKPGNWVTKLTGKLIQIGQLVNRSTK